MIATQTKGVIAEMGEWVLVNARWYKVIATREKDAKTTTQSRYYLLSTSLSAERFLAVTRAH